MSDETIFSFAPDRKSMQRATFTAGSTEFSMEESLRSRVARIYQDRFSNINLELRQELTDALVPGVPLLHRNLEMAAAANWLIHIYLQETPDATLQDMSPETLESLFQNVEGVVMPSIKEDYDTMRAKIKTTLYRYIVYVWRHTVKKSSDEK